MTSSLCTYFLHKYLHAAENVARGGRVTQSSVYIDSAANGSPEKAIDGNHANVWNQKSCSHTLGETNPWWSVNLGKRYKVNSVKITNRKDCCSDRLNGAEIRIGSCPRIGSNPRYVLITHIMLSLCYNYVTALQASERVAWILFRTSALAKP